MNLAQHQVQKEKSNQQKVASSIVNHNLLLKNVKQATQNVMNNVQSGNLQGNNGNSLTEQNVQSLPNTAMFRNGLTIPNEIILQATDTLSNSGSTIVGNTNTD